MPIRADNRKYYDARRRKFRLSMLEAADNVCQRCGKPHRLLNVAHLTHDRGMGIKFMGRAASAEKAARLSD